MKLKGIIFDVDGTIANTEESHRRAFNQAFEEFNINWRWSENDYRKILLISGGKERFKKFLDEDKNLKSKIDNPKRFIQDLYKRKSQLYRSILKHEDIQLRPGVIRLINEARDKKIKLGIASSSSMANLTTLLNKTLAIEPCELFNAIVSSDTIQDKKPSPAAYHCILAGLGLSANSCVAIEDTQNGNFAALAAGLKTIITTHDYTTDNDFSGASIVIDSLGEPDKPFSLSKGNNYDKSYVDVELLNAIISELEWENNKLNNVAFIH